MGPTRHRNRATAPARATAEARPRCAMVCRRAGTAAPPSEAPAPKFRAMRDLSLQPPARPVLTTIRRIFKKISPKEGAAAYLKLLKKKSKMFKMSERPGRAGRVPTPGAASREGGASELPREPARRAQARKRSASAGVERRRSSSAVLRTLCGTGSERACTRPLGSRASCSHLPTLGSWGHLGMTAGAAGRSWTVLAWLGSDRTPRNAATSRVEGHAQPRGIATTGAARPLLLTIT